MNRFTFATFLLFFLTLCRPLSAEEIVAVDTIQFVADRVQAEPNPNSGEYVFAMWGNALDEQWKLQIDYYADSEFGTFTDADFRLTSGGGAYNYLRKANNDMWMRSFKHLDVTVSDVAGATMIEVNGLIQDFGNWRRVLVQAEIPAPAPTDTVAVDLGRVMEVPNTFLGYTILEAKNAEYELTFGLSGTSELHVGTYYQVEILRPIFVALPADTIPMASAQLQVSERMGTDYLNLDLDLLGENGTLYQIQMHTGEPESSDTVQVHCSYTSVSDLSQTYGIYQFYGESADYNVAIAFSPGVIEQSMITVPSDSINLAYSAVVRRADLQTTRIEYATAQMELDALSGQVKAVHAEMMGTDGILYQVLMPFDNSSLPAAADTVYVDCGTGVGRVDYSFEPGWVGFVLAQEEADVHIVVYNDMKFDGVITSENFDYSQSYVTTYADNDQTIRFADVQMAQMRFDSIGNNLQITLDAITVSNILYHFTATLTPKRALTGNRVKYDVSDLSETMMIALRNTAPDGKGGTYRMQFQRVDGYNEDGEVVGDYEIWDFRFTQTEIDGIAGTYGYAAETLSNESIHYLQEDNTEIQLKPLAGTITLEALSEVTLPLDPDYRTHIYSIKAEFVAANNIIYELEGNNYLLCADNESGEMIELSEAAWSNLNKVLEEQGLKVRKVLRDGMILLERGEKCYLPSGIKK